MFTKNSVSQSMIDAVNKILEADTPTQSQTLNEVNVNPNKNQAVQGDPIKKSFSPQAHAVGMRTTSRKDASDAYKKPQTVQSEQVEDNLHPVAKTILKHIKPEHHAVYKPYLQKKVFNGSYADRSAVLSAAQDAGHLKEEVEELSEDNLHPVAKTILKHIKPEHHAIYKPYLKKGVFNGSYADRRDVLSAAERAGHTVSESAFDWSAKGPSTVLKKKGESAGFDSKKISTGTVYTRKPTKPDAKDKDDKRNNESVKLEGLSFSSFKTKLEEAINNGHLDDLIKSHGFHKTSKAVQKMYDDGHISKEEADKHMNYLNSHPDKHGSANYHVEQFDLNETLSKHADAGAWIHDFLNSDNPKFQGKSKEKRKQMALAAYYAKQRNESVENSKDDKEDDKEEAKKLGISVAEYEKTAKDKKEDKEEKKEKKSGKDDRDEMKEAAVVSSRFTDTLKGRVSGGKDNEHFSYKVKLKGGGAKPEPDGVDDTVKKEEVTPMSNVKDVVKPAFKRMKNETMGPGSEGKEYPPKA